MATAITVSGPAIAPPQDEALITEDAHLIAKNVLESSKRKGTYVTQEDMANAIETIQFLGASPTSSLVVTLLDEDWHIMDSGIFDTDENQQIDPIDLNYPDGSKYWWRLTQIAPKADHTLQLTFLPRVVALLLAKKGPKSADRARTTRAEFLDSLCKDVKGHGGIRFFSRELHIKEPIASSGTAGAAGGTTTKSGKAALSTVAAPVKGGGTSVGWTFFTDPPPGAGNLNTNEYCFAELGTASVHTGGATGHGNLAKALGLPGELPMGAAVTFTANGRSIVCVKQDRGAGQAPYGPDGAGDPAYAVDFWVFGGKNPMAALGLSGGKGTGLGASYNGRTVSAGPGGGSSSAVQTTQAYNFTVGSTETYWDAMVRLAQEVDWDLFVDGDLITYDSQPRLVSVGPTVTIHRDNEEVIDWDYTWDARQIVTTMNLQIICGMFEFVPDDVVKLLQFGPASTTSTIKPPHPGLWLIDSFSRNKGDLFTALVLKQPKLPKLEPAPQVSSSGGGSGALGAGGGVTPSGNKIVDATWSEAVRISRMNLPYTWGGGHGSFNPSPGYDCSGYVSACLHAAGVLGSPLDSTGLESWGQAGPGQIMTVWANAGHTFLEFKFPGAPGHMQANTSPGPGPHAFPWGQNGAADAAGGSFVARHWPGT